MTARRHPNQRNPSELPAELRRTTVPPLVRAWIERETGTAVQVVRRLPGASTSAVHRIDLDGGRRLVCRRYVWPGAITEDPDAPRREVDALIFLARHDRVPAPRVVASDLTGTGVGDGVPVVLMTFVPGRAIAAPDTRRLAEVAAAIHDIDPAGFGHGYVPWYVDQLRGPPPGARRLDLWERAIELRPVAMPPYRPVFLHRDFHPGNVLWAHGRCSGVVDWTDACRGPAGCDIAHCRANLIDWAGAEVADRFVAAYESLTGTTHDSYWDVASVLEHDLDHWTPEEVAAAEQRLGRALACTT